MRIEFSETDYKKYLLYLTDVFDFFRFVYSDLLAISP